MSGGKCRNARENKLGICYYSLNAVRKVCGCNVTIDAIAKPYVTKSLVK